MSHIKALNEDLILKNEDYEIKIDHLNNECIQLNDKLNNKELQLQK